MLIFEYESTVEGDEQGETVNNIGPKLHDEIVPQHFNGKPNMSQLVNLNLDWPHVKEALIHSLRCLPLLFIYTDLLPSPARV